MTQSGVLAIVLLTVANVFMTVAWYGHLQIGKNDKWSALPVYAIVLISWGIALAEYAFQVPANRIGHESHGGPFNLFELKIIQEVISLVVFAVFAVYIFKTDKLQWNYIVGFIFLMLAVFFVFKKW